MKKILLILLFTISFLSCKAQNIVPIYEGSSDVASPRYYKDVDNDFNSFEGIWKWENGNDSWTIEFQKIQMFHRQIPKYNNTGFVHQYDDFLIGEYEYKENGVVLVQSMPVDSSNDPYESNIYAGNISTLDRGFPPCDECVANTRFIIAYIKDPTRSGLNGKIRMAHFVENGIEKIRMRMTNYDSDPAIVGPNYTGPLSLTVPGGIYTFIKQ